MAQSKKAKTTKGNKTTKSRKKTTPPKTIISKEINNSFSNDRFNAIAALVIMGLITVILMMVNNKYFGEKKKSIFNGNNVEVVKAQDLSFDANKIEKKKPVKENKNNIIEKMDKLENNKEKDINTSVQEKTGSLPEQKINLYFVKLDNNSEKLYLSSVKRSVNSGSTLKDTLNELIKGPNQLERRKGLMTAIPSDLRIKSIRVRNKTAEINFNGAIEHGGTGDILIKRIDQIIYTATQFNNIDSVIFKINGKNKKTLGSDGLFIGGPIHRRK